jgi:hypothetical protein
MGRFEIAIGVAERSSLEYVRSQSEMGGAESWRSTHGSPPVIERTVFRSTGRRLDVIRARKYPTLPSPTSTTLKCGQAPVAGPRFELGS